MERGGGGGGGGKGVWGVGGKGGWVAGGGGWGLRDVVRGERGCLVARGGGSGAEALQQQLGFAKFPTEGFQTEIEGSNGVYDSLPAAPERPPQTRCLC